MGPEAGEAPHLRSLCSSCSFQYFSVGCRRQSMPRISGDWGGGAVSPETLYQVCCSLCSSRAEPEKPEYQVEEGGSYTECSLGSGCLLAGWLTASFPFHHSPAKNRTPPVYALLLLVGAQPQSSWDKKVNTKMSDHFIWSFDIRRKEPTSISITQNTAHQFA